jgi:hypothetical protein
MSVIIATSTKKWENGRLEMMKKELYCAFRGKNSREAGIFYFQFLKKNMA